ncbi:chromogranin-A isoform X1 [Perognathus longimembris pacificus]|uniref:chromogranin-A isoform X1 n=1 Tax=Perognathus longimembris pacificus TaxID=214514 RepID=UPI0020194792|nr:chromogranin-A isoform X1 [Perognathus longimembris pacificus]
MRSAAVLALLLCAGHVSALPVNSPMNKGDAKVMRCIVEVISDSLSKPSPRPVSHECLETLQGDERILSILRHQNLLKELQDLALQGARERAQQQKRPSSFEEELSEVLQSQGDAAGAQEVTTEAAPEDAQQKREDAEEAKPSGATQGTKPQASPEPGPGSPAPEHSQAPGEEAATTPQAPASLPGQKQPGPQAVGSREDPSQGLSAAQRPREEEEEAGEKAVPQDEDPTAAFDAHPALGSKNIQKGESGLDALAPDGAGQLGAEQARDPTGHTEEEEEEEEAAAGPPRGLFQGGGKSGERLSREWGDAKRWSKMEQLAKELTAEKRPDREDEDDDPDRSMRLSFRARAYGLPGPPLRWGWRPSSREDVVEEKKEEEGSANRRAEDQELESLSAIEAELEKVARQLQALRQG